MNLSKHISDLLYRYDCVIVPNFGGFVTNKIGAKIDDATHIFYPPSKQITFNSYLKHNDGLLVNYISATEHISFDEANVLISKEILDWNRILSSRTLNLKGIGSLTLNPDRQLCFEPERNSNFLTESFGLSTINTYDINREGSKVIPLESGEVSYSIPKYVKYAAAAAILMTFGMVGLKADQMERSTQVVAEQGAYHRNIQEAGFIVDTDLSINQEPKQEPEKKVVKVVKEVEAVTKQEPVKVKEQVTVIEEEVVRKPVKTYYIIAGAFRSQKNAEKKVKQLVKSGFNSEIVGKNKYGLIQVAYEGFEENSKASQQLRKIRKNVNKEAWILVK